MSDISMEDLEQEQLDYLRRNYDKTMHIPNSTDMNLDILDKPIDDRIILSETQEKKLVEEVIKRQRDNELLIEKSKSVVKPFSLSAYGSILTESFVEIMDDLLEFDGDIEKLPSIFSKGDRLVFMGTLLLFSSLYFIYTRSSTQRSV